MRKSYILVPLLIGILMISAVHVPAARAMSIADLQVQILKLDQMIVQLRTQLSQLIKRVKVSPPQPPLSPKVRYSCRTAYGTIPSNNYSVCVPDPNGPFSSLEECENSCPSAHPITTISSCATLSGKYSMSLAEAKYLFRNSECKSLGNPDVLPVKCLQCNPETIHSRLYNAIYGEDTTLLDKAAYEIGQCIINVKTKQAYINKGPGFCTGATEPGAAFTIVCAEQGTPKEGWYEVRGYDDDMNPNLRIKLLKLTHCSNCQLKCTPSGFVDTCDNSILKTLKEAFGPEADSCYKSGVPPVDPSYVRNLIRESLPSASANLPDLIISDLSASKTSGVMNEKITISVSEKNIGTGTAALHHVIVSEENKEGVIPILVSTSKPLAPGDTFTARGTFTCYYPGKHTLIARANYKTAAGIVNIKGIQESNEANNTKTITINCTAPIGYKCTDSDGGKNYYVKGFVIDALGFTRHDMCMTNNTLLEEYCENNNATDEYYTCPSGYICQDGACRRKIGPKPIPPKPIGQCGWCGVSCQRIQSGMYCPQIAPPAGYRCVDVNGKCMKVRLLQNVSQALPNSVLSELQSGLAQIRDTINKLSASLMNVFPAH